MIVALSVQILMYDATSKSECEGRTRALQMFVADLAGMSATRLVIEQDDSLVKADRQTLYSASCDFRVRDRLHYDYVRVGVERARRSGLVDYLTAYPGLASSSVYLRRWLRATVAVRAERP